MSLDEVGEILASYVPLTVVNNCIVRPKGLAWEPAADEFDGAVVFCDISGFTALTERLATEGADGAEKLVQFLNSYFGKLVSIVFEHGGDVMNFAGDALLAVWKATSGETLQAVTLRATRCAFIIQGQMNVKGVADQPRLHMGVGAGRLSLLQVGGKGDQWVPILTGQPLLQISPACHAASPDLTVVSKEVWALVSASCEGELLDHDGLVRLISVNTTDPSGPVPRSGALDSRATGTLRMFIPKVIQRTTTKGQNSFVAELRHASIMFININDLDMSSSSCLPSVHAVVSTVQKTIEKYGGIINKMLLDDKGFVVLAGFGLPPFAHENDQERAINAAMLTKRELNRENIVCSIGVTSGRAFCGVVGSELRREYTMIGDVVNTSARLMTHTHDMITVDRPTVERAMAINHRLVFNQLESKQFKGKKFKIEIFTPVENDRELPKQLKDPDVMIRMNTSITGRSKETLRIGTAIGTLLKDKVGAVFLIEGETGSGKTRVLEEAARLGRQAGLAVYSGCGDPVEKTTPFYPWRGIFMEIFGLRDLNPTAENRQRLMDKLEKEARFALNFAPLLNAIVDLGLPENSHTTPLNPKQKLDRTGELLLTFLATACKKPTMVLLEDLQHFDASSRNLAVLFAQTYPNVLIVYSTRTYVRAPPYINSLKECKNIQPLELKGLNGGAIAKLACRRIGVDALPDRVRHDIVTKCGGNPFFAQEFAMSLREYGIIKVDGEGHCELTEPSLLDTVRLPGSLESVLLCRIDQLTSSQALALKVASAIGMEFDANILYHIFPTSSMSQEDLKKQVDEDIDVLVDMDLINRQQIATGFSFDAMAAAGRKGNKFFRTSKIYTFVNSMTHSATYALMLEAQKKNLHLLIAGWYEQAFTGSHNEVGQLLAYHYTRAHKPAKAVQFLAVAAQQALTEGNSDEAANLVKEALEKSTQTNDVPLSVRARLRRLYAEALYDLGEEEEARSQLISGHALLGVEVAETSTQMFYELLFSMQEREREVGDSVQVGPEIVTPAVAPAAGNSPVGRGLKKNANSTTALMGSDSKKDDKKPKEEPKKPEKKDDKKDDKKDLKAAPAAVTPTSKTAPTPTPAGAAATPPKPDPAKKPVRATPSPAPLAPLAVDEKPRTADDDLFFSDEKAGQRSNLGVPNPAVSSTGSGRESPAANNTTESSYQSFQESPRTETSVLNETPPDSPDERREGANFGRRGSVQNEAPSLARRLSQQLTGTVVVGGTPPPAGSTGPMLPPRPTNPRKLSMPPPVVADMPRNMLFSAPAAGWTEISPTPGMSGSTVMGSLEVRAADADAEWFREYFYGEKHIVVWGGDTDSGSTLVAATRDLADDDQLRVLVLSPLYVQRLLVPRKDAKVSKGASSLPSLKPLLKVLTPELPPNDFKQLKKSNFRDLVQDAERFMARDKFRASVIHVPDGCLMEEHVYSGDGTSTEFDTFVNTIGTKIDLKGFTGYSGGLDVTGNTTGTHSVHTTWRNCEIMYLTSSFIPVTERARLLSATFVSIVFLESSQPYNIAALASVAARIVVVVQLVVAQGGSRCYRVGLSLRDGVQPFAPPVPDTVLSPAQLRWWLGAMCVQGDRAVCQVAELKAQIVRERQVVLENVVTSCT